MLRNTVNQGPTIFPIVFAAIVGGAMKVIATWRLQRGTTLGFVEQLLGSNTISGAVLTQAQLLAFNFTGLVLLILWALSPLGSQASLRVVSIVPSFAKSNETLAMMNSFTGYMYGTAAGASAAMTIVLPPFIASMMSAKLLESRNQDLWGNIRLPAIESLTNDEDTNWINVTNPSSVQYPSLVGIPMASLPSIGNTRFTFSNSYLNITCGVLEQQGNFTNFSSPDFPKPGGSTDCTWLTQTTFGFQIAMSEPCESLQLGSGTREARRLLWESNDQLGESSYTHAECEIYTTYVDVDMLCVGSNCSPLAVKRSSQPPLNRNWTVLDFEGGSIDIGGFLGLLADAFPSAGQSGMLSPIVAYLVNPNETVGYLRSVPAYSVGKPLFEMRLAQLLNTELILGQVDPSQVTSGFNVTLATESEQPVMQVPSITTTEQALVRCDRAWLGILVVASLTAFLVAFVSATVRLATFVPDILGTVSLAMLDNKCQSLAGSSTWSWRERAGKMRGVKLRLGDINPEDEVGQIALGGPLESVPVNAVQRRRLYQ